MPVKMNSKPKPADPKRQNKRNKGVGTVFFLIVFGTLTAIGIFTGMYLRDSVDPFGAAFGVQKQPAAEPPPVYKEKPVNFN